MGATHFLPDLRPVVLRSITKRTVPASSVRYLILVDVGLVLFFLVFDFFLAALFAVAPLPTAKALVDRDAVSVRGGPVRGSPGGGHPAAERPGRLVGVLVGAHVAGRDSVVVAVQGARAARRGRSATRRSRRWGLPAASIRGDAPARR